MKNLLALILTLVFAASTFANSTPVPKKSDEISKDESSKKGEEDLSGSVNDLKKEDLSGSVNDLKKEEAQQ